MMRIYRCAFLLAALLPMACAPTTQWVRDGAGMAQRDRDEAECQQIADGQALDESFASGPIYEPLRDTQFTIDGGDGDSGGGITASYSRRGARAYELAAYCMEQRGYRLAPLPS